MPWKGVGLTSQREAARAGPVVSDAITDLSYQRDLVRPPERVSGSGDYPVDAAAVVGFTADDNAPIARTLVAPRAYDCAINFLASYATFVFGHSDLSVRTGSSL